MRAARHGSGATPRVGVPRPLLELAPVGGHGKVWHRVLGELGELHPVVPIDSSRPRLGRLRTAAYDVVLASGHDRLPPIRRPLVIQLHEAGWLRSEHHDLIDPEFTAYISRHTEAAVARAAEVIVPSRSARREVIAAYGLPAERVHAVPHGVDPGFTAQATGGRQLVARALGRDAPYVLYAATLHPRKNLALLREAMSRLAAAGLPHALAIAGHSAPDRADSGELAREARDELPGAPGRVAWLGQPSDAELAGLMAEADAFCLPSLHEGFGLSVLEAMACGAPVLVSDRGSLPEVVGDTGLVAAPTAEAFTAVLGGLLRDRALAARLGASAARRAREFTWRRTAAGWSEVLAGAAYTRGA